MRIVLFVLAVVFGAPFALLGFLLMASPPQSPDLRAATPVVAFALLFGGWAVFPLFLFGLDETLDPARLALLPLRRSRLMAGLMAASSVGVGPMVSLVALSGAVLGYGRGLTGTAIAVVAVAVQFALCVTISRAVVTALTRLLRSRRTRDLFVVLSLLLFAALNPLLQLPRLLAGSLSPEAVDRLVLVLSWSPPGLAGRALAEAEVGRLATATWHVALAALFLVPLGLWWSHSLDRLTTTAEPANRGTGGSLVVKDLFPGPVRFLPRNRLGAVTAKEFRYLWREPQFRAQRILSALFAVGAVVAMATLPGDPAPESVLAAAGLMWLFTLYGINQFAIDRGAYWLHVVTPGDPGRDLVAKNLANALVNVPPFVVVLVGLAAVSDGWVYVPLAACLGAGALGASFGPGNVASVRLAQPLPESSTNLWATSPGQGCGTALLIVLILVANLLLALPLAALVLIGVRAWRPLLLLAGPISLAYGGVIYGLGLRVAVEWLRHHQPELLEALTPRRTI
jgi:ABC-2 type transport system permease protein